jgi:hypothetical protein
MGACRLPVSGVIIEVGQWKINTKGAKSDVLGTRLGLEEAIGLSDVVRSGEKDANLLGSSLVSQGSYCHAVGLMRKMLPKNFRSRGNIEQVER